MITKDSKNILVADDSIFFRVRLSDILVEAGHKVRFASNGEEIIGEIRSNPNGIDLLILDLQMPGMDGFGVLKWIADNGVKGRFPVLIITAAYAPEDVVEELRLLGASGMLSKEFTPEKIIFRVNGLLFPDKTTKRASAARPPESLPVDFSLGGRANTGFMLNVSENGIFLHAEEEFLVGSMLSMRFSLPGSAKVFSVKGVVKWSTEGVGDKPLLGGYGVGFVSLGAEEARLIKEYVEAQAKKP